MKKWKKRTRTVLQYFLFFGGFLLTIAAGLEAENSPGWYEGMFYMALGMTMVSAGSWLSCVENWDSVIWTPSKYDNRPPRKVPAVAYAVIFTVTAVICWGFCLVLFL